MIFLLRSNEKFLFFLFVYQIDKHRREEKKEIFYERIQSNFTSTYRPKHAF